MKLQRFFRLALCCAIAGRFISVAHAGTVTFDFSGAVTQVPVDDNFGDILFGDLISGAFSFDSAATDSIAGLTTGSFTSTGALFGMAVTVGAYNFSTFGTLNIGVVNAAPDQYTVLAQSAGGDLTLELFFQDNGGAVFSNDFLPAVPPPLASFALRDFHLHAVLPAGETQVDGQIANLTCPGCTVSEVPEPSSRALLVSALVLLAGVRFRRLAFHHYRGV